MTALAGKRVLVAGGTGDVGEGIVRALLGAGASVIVPARSPAKAERLRAGLPDAAGLTTVPGEAGVPEAASAVAAMVQADGPLDGVVASLGGWWQGPPLTEVTPDVWHELIANNLTSHFAVARAFVPLLRAGGVFVQVLGGAAAYPAPNSSLVSITAAAVAMMGRVMQAELGAAVQVRQIQVNSFVATRSRKAADPSWVTADEVGETAAGLIAGTLPGELTVHLNAKP